ncbi:MAG: S24/S26 family peptidase [Lachnospiraceae bacterium]|nr:S24/S26 family peptidase [Lachnospiraceae bacterium]
MYNDQNRKIRIEELLSENKSVQLHPIGYSMYPLIVPERDEVIISPLRNHKIRRGDVLLYKRKSGKFVLHRVYKIRGDSLFFVGDNESEIEGPLNISQVYGIMSSFYHNGRLYRSKNPFYIISYNVWLFLLPFRKPISSFIHNLKNRH